jgi:hypothetical protein
MAIPLSIKEKLQLYIETADEQKLQAIYTLLEDEINLSYYSKEDIELFHQRKQSYLQEPGESYTADESLKTIRKSGL